MAYVRREFKLTEQQAADVEHLLETLSLRFHRRVTLSELVPQLLEAAAAATEDDTEPAIDLASLGSPKRRH